MRAETHGLPPNWQAIFDEQSKRQYYYNAVTGKSKVIYKKNLSLSSPDMFIVTFTYYFNVNSGRNLYQVILLQSKICSSLITD
jgi:hypothetical protein